MPVKCERSTAEPAGSALHGGADRQRCTPEPSSTMERGSQIRSQPPEVLNDALGEELRCGLAALLSSRRPAVLILPRAERPGGEAPQLLAKVLA